MTKSDDESHSALKILLSQLSFSMTLLLFPATEMDSNLPAIFVFVYTFMYNL